MTFNHSAQRTITAIALLLFCATVTAPLQAAGSGVHGRVLGHDEAGEFVGVVQGASIVFEDQAGSKVGTTVADSNGYFKIDLPPGAYIYKIKAEGFRSDETGRGLQLAQSQGYAIFNLSLTKGKDDPSREKPSIPKKQIGTLKGRVLEKTANGLVGVSDATITLRLQDSKMVRSVLSRTVGDASHPVGEYQTSLETGNYSAAVVAPGFEIFTDPQPIELRSASVTSRDFVLSRRELSVNIDQGIRGVVTIEDSGKTPPKVHLQIVSLASATDFKIDVPLSINGAFSKSLPEGSFQVIATAEGYPTASSPPTHVLKGGFSSVNLSLRARRTPEPKTVVEVDVFTRTQGRTERKSLEGARVSLLKSGAALPSAMEAVTDSSGHALFPVSASGEYTATAFLKGFRSGSGVGAVQIGERHEVEIELVQEEFANRKEVLVNVEVKDSLTKRPLAGVKILARHPEEALAAGLRATTNSDGKALFTFQRTGKCQILAQLAGYTPGGSVTELSDSITNLVSLNLQPIEIPNRPPNIVPEPSLPSDETKPPHEPTVTKPYPLDGYVAYRETSGQLRSIPDVKLIWERTAPANPPVSFLTSTGSNGKFKVNLHTGTYQVQINPPSGFEPTLEQVDIDPSVHEKYFIIRQLDRKPPSDIGRQLVQGNVVTEMAGRSMGVSSAEISFTRLRNVEKTITNRSGGFSIQLATDTYRVQVRANGFESLDTQTVIGPSQSPLRFVLKRIEAQPNLFNLNLTVVEQGNALIAGIRTVANAKVLVEQDGKQVASGATSRTGQFSAQLKSGSYRVHVEKQGYASATSAIAVSNSDVIEQIALKANSDATFDQLRKSKLSVRVLRRNSQPSNTIQRSGLPLAGAQVTVMSGAKPISSGVSNPFGIFEVPLTTGSYSIKVEMQGFVPSTRMFSINDRDSQVDVLLDPVVTSSPGAFLDSRLGPPSSSNNLSSRRQGLGANPKTEVNYIVEYRLTPQAEWRVVTTKSSQREANLAIALAIERRQIPAIAETRIRTEKK